MIKLGRNQGGYRGETIDISSVLRDIETAARRSGWTFESMATQRGDAPTTGPRPPDPTGANPAPPALHAWRRTPRHVTRRVYLSAGIHGDEPAGPLAIRQLVLED